MVELKRPELREALAELEHDQWTTWSKTVTDQVIQHSIEETGKAMFKKHQKWLPNWKSYDELDEKTKDFDREWADKVLAIMDSFLSQVADELESHIGQLKHQLMEEKDLKREIKHLEKLAKALRGDGK